MVYLPHWPVSSTIGKKDIDYEAVFDRCSELLEKLGNPHKKLPPTIHIAGTNGKGSSTAFFAEIFKQSNYKFHTYTSPHLHESNERIVLNGEKISDNYLYQIMEEVRLAAGETHFTFMEAFTCGAFLAFSRIEADILILECGMGGRIDITNILDQKLLTLITPVSFDHVEYLGTTIERIALEKAMIMRPNTPLIVSSQASEAKNIIKILADDQKLPAYYYDQDFSIILDQENGNFDFEFGQDSLTNLPKPALPGDHQYINFASVIAAMMVIKKQFPFTKDQLKKAISNVYWPSRLEKVQNKLNKILENNNSEIWIDGAHNSSGAFALTRWIASQDQSKKTFIVCGFSRTKCRSEFLIKFKDIADIYAVLVNGEPYAEDPEVISKIGADIGLDIPNFTDLGEAIFSINKLMKDQPCRIVICGSLHLARDVRDFN